MLSHIAVHVDTLNSLKVYTNPSSARTGELLIPDEPPMKRNRATGSQSATALSSSGGGSSSSGNHLTDVGEHNSTVCLLVTGFDPKFCLFWQFARIFCALSCLGCKVELSPWTLSRAQLLKLGRAHSLILRECCILYYCSSQ